MKRICAIDYIKFSHFLKPGTWGSTEVEPSWKQPKR